MRDGPKLGDSGVAGDSAESLGPPAAYTSPGFADYVKSTLQSFVSALCAPAAMLTLDGTIVVANVPWEQVAERSGRDCLRPGSNYLDYKSQDALRGNRESLAVLSGLAELLAGNRSRTEAVLCSARGCDIGRCRISMSVLNFGGDQFILVERLVGADPARPGQQCTAVDGRLLRAQEEERRRIARDLHDSTSQWLVGLQLNIAQLNQSVLSTPFAPLIADCESALAAIQREIRAVSYLCHPPLLGTRSLACALELMTRGFAERAGLDVEIDMQEVGEIAPAIEATFYRLTQEALANIHRHAKASTIGLRLSGKRKYVHLLIEDDGIGFDATRSISTPGVGVAGMKERVEQMSGRLSIRPRGHGTSVLASLPRRRRVGIMGLGGHAPVPRPDPTPARPAGGCRSR